MPFVQRSKPAILIALLAVAAIAFVCLPTRASALSGSQETYLGAAKRGIKQTGRWWDSHIHWYSSVLGGHNAATLWQTVPLFEALSGIEQADPSPRHLSALTRFGWAAERYLNTGLQPVPCFGNHQFPHGTAWFDDNGWWGLAFLDAYRATGNPRYLTDAEIAQNCISVSGWDATPGRPGGLWWNTNESFYAGESLAGGTLLSARLYSITHAENYLDDALKFIRWGDVWLTDPGTGLYARLRKPGTYAGVANPQSTGAPATGPTQAAATAADQRAFAKNPDEAQKLEAAGGGIPMDGAAASANSYPPFDPVPMPYVNGPMILAHRIICEATGVQSYCARASQLAGIAQQVYQHFSMGPQYDFWYVRSMLEFARDDQNSDWYSMLATNAATALRKARGRHNLYLKTWYGQGPGNAGAPGGSLQLHAANAALFAWMSVLGR